MTQQKSVLDWLKDAHAMEAGGVVTLTNHAEAAGDYPEVGAKLREHAEATRRHADLLEGRLKDLGAGPSSLKEAVGAALSKVAGIANLPAGDTVVKNALGDLAAENFEIASYLSLIAAAETVGDRETAAVCEQILRDEERMADWLRAQIPEVTRQFLARQGDAEGGGRLEGVKQTVQNVGEQVKAAAPDAGDTRNALLVSGALLAGAGAALLVGKALLGGSEGQHEGQHEGQREEPREGQNEPARDVQPDPQPGPAADASKAPALMEAPSDTSAETVASAELADLNDARSGDTDLSGMGNADGATSQDEFVAETVGGDAGFLVASEEPYAAAQAASVGATPVEAEVAAPELRDGSQTAAVPSAEADRGATGAEGAELWRVPGPFSGLGPLEQSGAGGPLGEVYERLTQHGHVDATHMEVTLEGDRVRLGGFVDSESTKRLALAAVRSVSGVAGVDDALEVRVTNGV